MNAWLDSADLKCAVLERVMSAASPLSEAMTGGKGLCDFPRALGLPTHFGFALDILQMNASTAVARTLGAEIVEAIDVGVDVSCTTIALLAEVLRRKQGSHHPLVKTAVVAMIDVTKKQSELRHFQIYDAARDCEHARRVVSRKKRDNNPAMNRAYEAALFGELLGDLIASDAFIKDKRAEIQKAIHYGIGPRDVDQGLVNWFVEFLGTCQDEPDYDPDFELYWHRQGSLQSVNK